MCECIVTELKLKKGLKPHQKGQIVIGLGFASKIYVREWASDKGCAYTYHVDRMERIYGPAVASQVCGQKSVSGEIAYTLDEEPSEEVRNVALRDAPTDTLSWASTEVRNPYAIDRPP